MGGKIKLYQKLLLGQNSTSLSGCFMWLDTDAAWSDWTHLHAELHLSLVPVLGYLLEQALCFV